MVNRKKITPTKSGAELDEIQDDKSLNFGHVTRLNELEGSAQGGMSWRLNQQSYSNDGISSSINDKQIETQ